MPERFPDEVTIREATAGDALDVRRVVDAAMLEVEGLGERIDQGNVLVATADATVVGAIVLAPEGPPEEAVGAAGLPSAWADATHVRAIAVRRRRRGAGIGRQLLAAAVDRAGRLVADFDATRRDFYDAVGATVREGEDGRCWAMVRST